MTLLLIAVGGGVGAAARFATDGAVSGWVRSPRRVGALVGTLARMPFATLLINVVGSFVLGLLTGIGVAHAGVLPETLRSVLGTGFCGGFTTFSTASVEAARLWSDGERGPAVRYAVASVVCAGVFAALGLLVGGFWSGSGA